MAKNNFAVSAELRAKDAGASATIGKVQGRFARLAGFLRSSAFLGAFASVGVAVAKLVRLFNEATTAFGVQVAAVQKLRGALEPLGPEADRVTAALTKQASALQQVTTFGDEAIIGAQSLLASFTRNEEEIKSLTQTTLDFSAATGIDLNSAASLVGRSFASSTNALTRYGIEVEGAAGSTERLNALTENSARIFGGQAQAAVLSYAGAMKQLDNAQGDVLEGIGGLVVGSPEYIQAINRNAKATATLSDELTKLEGSGTGAAISFQNFGNAISTNLANFLFAVRATLGLSDAAGKAAKAVQKQADAQKEAAGTGNILAGVFGALLQVTNELVDAEERRARALETTGIRTNSQLAEEIDKLRESQGEYDQLLRDGEIGRTRYAEGTARIANEIAALEAVQSGSVATVEEYKEAFDAGADSLDAFGASAIGAASSQRSVTTALRATAVEAARTSQAVLLTARAFDELERASGRAAAVDAAVAGGGQLVLGGTRVNLFGGSRLTSAPGLQSRNPINSTFSQLPGGQFSRG